MSEFCQDCGKPPAAHPAAILNTAARGLTFGGRQFRINPDTGVWETRLVGGDRADEPDDGLLVPPTLNWGEIALVRDRQAERDAERIRRLTANNLLDPYAGDPDADDPDLLPLPRLTF
jgi:hypothetical protein